MGNKSTSSLCHDSSNQGSTHSSLNNLRSTSASSDDVITHPDVIDTSPVIGKALKSPIVTVVERGGKCHPGTPVKKDKNLDVRIYRSYSSSTATKGRTVPAAEPTVDIKVYKRRPGSVSRANSARSEDKTSSTTLPRHLDRACSLSQGSRATRTRGRAVSSDHTAPPPSRNKDEVFDRMNSKRKLLVNNAAKDVIDGTPDPCHVGSALTHQTLNEFETRFIKHLTHRFNRLSEFLQISSLAIATGPSSQSISLWEYLSSDLVPFNLLEQDGDACNQRSVHCLMIPPALFHKVMRARSEGTAKDQRVASALAREIFMNLATEAASELCAVYKYQIGLLSAPTEIDLLARHSVDCVMDYLKEKNGVIDRNNVVHGAVYGSHAIPPEYQKSFSVIVGEKEHKWPLEDIFKRPGLMIQTSQTLSTESQDSSKCPPSWRYYSSATSDPITFGYRTVITEIDYTTGIPRPSREDAMLFLKEVCEETHEGAQQRAQEEDWNRAREGTREETLVDNIQRHSVRSRASIDSNQNKNIANFNGTSSSNHREILNRTMRPNLTRASSVPVRSKTETEMLRSTVARADLNTKNVNKSTVVSMGDNFKIQKAIESWNNDCGFYSCRARSVVAESRKIVGDNQTQDAKHLESDTKLARELVPDVEIPDLLKFSARNKPSSIEIGTSDTSNVCTATKTYSNESRGCMRMISKDNEEKVETVPITSTSTPSKVFAPRLPVRKTASERNRYRFLEIRSESMTPEGRVEVEPNNLGELSVPNFFKTSSTISTISSVTSDLDNARRQSSVSDQVVSNTPVEALFIKSCIVPSADAHALQTLIEVKDVDKPTANRSREPLEHQSRDFISFDDFLNVIDVQKSTDAKPLPIPSAIDVTNLPDTHAKLSTNIVKSNSVQFAPNVNNFNRSNYLNMNRQQRVCYSVSSNGYTRDSHLRNDIVSEVITKDNKRGQTFMNRQMSEIVKPVFTADVSLIAVTETDCDVIAKGNYIPLEIVAKRPAVIVGSEKRLSPAPISKLKMNIGRETTNTGVLVSNL